MFQQVARTTTAICVLHDIQSEGLDWHQEAAERYWEQRSRRPLTMGYDLHITRKKLYVDQDGPEITWDEWKAYVATDPELRLAPDLGKHMVAVSINCQYPDPWLEWYEGSIDTKNPDEAILAKMLQIAAALKAKVQGDDGEIYRSANFSDHYDED